MPAARLVLQLEAEDMKAGLAFVYLDRLSYLRGESGYEPAEAVSYRSRLQKKKKKVLPILPV